MPKIIKIINEKEMQKQNKKTNKQTNKQKTQNNVDGSYSERVRDKRFC